NAYTPGYQAKAVDIQAGDFTEALQNAQGGVSTAVGGATDSMSGAVRVTGTHIEDAGDPRINALRGTVEMMESKTAFGLNLRVATLLKSMATASLEIGRGG